MENRTESVYECTLAIETHMICDLLADAGIPARVGTNTVAMLNTDGDGNAGQVRYLERGVVTDINFHARGGGHVAKRQHFRAGLVASAELDDGGDGLFERRVGYDQPEEPML